MIWDEASLIVERVNMMLATETSLLHQVMTTAVSAFGKDGGRSAHASLTKTLTRLANDGGP